METFHKVRRPLLQMDNFILFFTLFPVTVDKSKWIVDPVQKSMGQLGPWHIIAVVLIFILKFPTAWHQLGIVFLAPPVSYTCHNASIDKCSKDCHEWDYDTNTFTRTIATEWDLVCLKSNLVNLSQTIFMFGILTGSMLFGTLADKFGRRRPLVVAVIVQLIVGTATSLAPWFWLFVTLRFILAVATGGTMVTR
jgi:MFS family permease